jgi:hypothetical protein
VVRRDVACGVARIVSAHPQNRGNEVFPAVDLIHHHLQIGLFTVIAVNPDGPVATKEALDLDEAVSHHRQPHGVFQGVVVLLERLLSVEGRVDIGELHLAEILALELGDAGQAGQGV